MLTIEIYSLAPRYPNFLPYELVFTIARSEPWRYSEKTRVEKTGVTCMLPW